MLHPRLRQHWFKEKWSHFPSFNKKADSSVRSVYEAYKKKQQQIDVISDTLSEPASQPSRRKVPRDAARTLFDDTITVDL